MSNENNGLNSIRDAIEAAEEVPDLLEELVEKSQADPGVAFAPEMVKHIAMLKRDDPAAFETLRARLRKTRCRVSVLDKAIAEETGEAGGGRPTQSDILIELAAEVELFHTADGTAYGNLHFNGHRETWPVRSKGFKRWLTRRFFEATEGAPNSDALQAALNLLEARAHFDAPQGQAFIRVAGHGEKLYVDLADDSWRAIEIDGAGWRVVGKTPVRFRRAAGMGPLPVPIPGGSVEMLRHFLNVGDEDFVLVVAWMLACLRDCGPYPALVLSGEQGSAKSTFCRVLRALLDPNAAPLRALPREDRELFIAANNQHLLVFDNVSGLPPWLSDTLCRLATGGGFAVRQLYTDQDEVLFDAMRPLVLNGITDIVNRPDLADRAIFLTLDPIPDECRRPEKELWEKFERARPKILGALLDAVSTGLRQYRETKLEKLPRMADFARWVTACEISLWPTGIFSAAYWGNRDEVVDNIIEADPVGSTIRSLMERQIKWKGTATELLEVLSDEVGERVTKTKAWPTISRALSGRVRRAAPLLRKVGIEIGFKKEGHARTRLIDISRKADCERLTSSLPSASSAEGVKGASGKGSEDMAVRTQEPSADANGHSPHKSSVRGIPCDT